MNLANLTAFVAVARHGSFSVAAAQLHLTQPAISKRISALESELDVVLFDRLGRHVQATEAGAVLLDQAERILASLDDVRRRIHDLSGDVRGRVGMATSHHVGLHRLPPVLVDFKAEYPDVRIDLRFLESEEACGAVAGGELELAVVTLPTTPLARLQMQPLWHDPLLVVAARDHPLALQEGLDATTLTRYPAILPGLETVTRQIIQRAFADQGVALEAEMSTNYLETIRMMVSIGLGWSVLPRTLMDDRLLSLPVNDLEMYRTLGVVWQLGRTLSNAARAMMTTLERAAEPAGG